MKKPSKIFGVPSAAEREALRESGKTHFVGDSCTPPHEPLHPEVKHCYDCKQLTCPKCTGCHNEKCVDEVARTSCGLLSKVNKLHQELAHCTACNQMTNHKDGKCLKCKDIKSYDKQVEEMVKENKGEEKHQKHCRASMGYVCSCTGKKPNTVCRFCLKDPCTKIFVGCDEPCTPPTTQSWSDRKAYTGWEADFVKKFWVSRLGGDHVGAQHDAVDFIRDLLKIKGEKNRLKVLWQAEAVEQERRELKNKVEYFKDRYFRSRGEIAPPLAVENYFLTLINQTK